MLFLFNGAMGEVLNAAQPATRGDLFLLIPAAGVVSFVAAVFGYWAVRNIRAQHSRASLLAENLEEMRNEARKQLEFLNAISHDLRTPLNGIALQTHVLEQAIAARDDAALRQCARELRDASVLAAGILDALLQYAHVDARTIVTTPVNLRGLVLEAAEPFHAAAEEKHLAFIVDVPEDLVTETDAEKLQRIVANLLGNAVKFTAHGGITLRARRVAGSIGGPGESVMVEVSDTGEGIARENQEKVFQAFFQANNPSRDARLGLGLGLVIAQRLAHQLGGTLTYESEFRQGTVFRLRLPKGAAADATIQH